ncbi:MAG: hypothetical protein NEA02_10645 [Thermoanaerobaculia bacterium]|nr:hypothetical protein [Thermoanaerobaculia bacterium]
MKHVAFLLLLLAIPAAAENSPIRAISEELHYFNSPMVLELDLNEFLKLPPGRTWNPEAITRFSCRLVTFGYLMLTASPTDPNKVSFRASLKNNSGKDKRIQMTFATSERCVVKVDPDGGGTCMGVLISPSPTVRLVVTVDDY